MRQRFTWAALVPLLLGVPAHAAGTVGPNDLYMRVVDVGPGLCTVTETPDKHYMVYDAGHWQGKRCFKAVKDIVDSGKTIDLLILSHTDGDHVGDAKRILDKYHVHQIIRTGITRTTTSWKNANIAIGKEVTEGATVINLQTVDLVPGEEIELGSDAKVTLIAGWGNWTASNLSSSEMLNAVSIVARLDFKGGSILLTGDSIGRRIGDPDSACKDAEEIMKNRHDQNVISLKADVVVAPHHGGDNGSSQCFVDRVDPDFVVFSAGHDHEHPRQETAQRWLTKVSVSDVFRTDRGDDEPPENGSSNEWKQGSVTGCKDPRGDDDVEIVIRSNGNVEVDYRTAGTGC